MDKSPAEIIRALERLKVPHEEIADALGRDRTVATKLLGNKRSMKVQEIPVLLALVEKYERDSGELIDPASRDYLPVEILPTFVGMGGGGSGDGDKEFGLVSRRMVVDELRAKPDDLLIIEARGDSMEPDFHHGDQILIDKRDTNPIQPGPFALWDGDGFVVKLVERVPADRSRFRIFSSNGRYSSYEVSADEVQIMGRPVWFGRRL